MSLQWPDFPSGQPGLYGTGATATTNMLLGTPWIAIDNVTVVADPDTLNFPTGNVLRHGAGSSGPTQCGRMAIDTPHQKVGLAVRFYCSSLPVSERTIYTFNTTGNVVQYSIRLLPAGGLRLCRGNSQTEVLLADYPVILGSTWNHLEFLFDVVTGEVEVRKNGYVIAALTGTDGSPPGGTIGIVGFPDRSSGQGGAGNIFFSKDIIVYNGAGSQINTFLGTVRVNHSFPDGDVTVGDWTLSTGSSAYALIDETTPSDADYVESGLIPTDPLTVTIEDLDPDITSVRAAVMIMRGFNSDGGDGSVQMSISPNAGVDVDSGVSHPMSATATYFYDISELSPATGVAWTPTEINSLEFTFDRTV